MQKTKKQILGAFGLGLVAAMTAVAFALPTPDASAVSSGDVVLKVVVNSAVPTVVVQTPSDGEEFTTSQIPISSAYSKAATVHYTLTYIDANGVRTDYTLPDYIAATSGTADGVHSWTLDLNNYGGQYGQYILSSTVGAVSDYVSFTYKSVNIDPGVTIDPATGNPIIRVSYSDDVCSLKIQAYNKVTNAALFNPEYVYTIPTPRPANNTSEITLPFAQYNADAGNYRVVVKAFGCGNNQNDQVGNEDEGDINNYQPKDNDNVTTDPVGDPIVKLDYNYPVEVCMVKFQAYNKATNAALFHPEYKYNITPPSKSGTVYVTLPFAEYGAESGDYRIVATYYDCNNNQLGLVNYRFDGYVKPLVPGVPDTGGGIFAGLNFSRGDYLATGLIIFMLALVIAIRIMAKNRKSDRR